MKTVGEILKSARIKKKLTTSQVAQKTKIQEKFIIALEKNDYSKLPESAFVKGFIRNYSQALNKDPQILLAVFRRDFSQDPKGKVVPRGLADSINQPRLRWTPRATTIAIFTTIITLFISYLIFQFRILSGAPKLTLELPQENQTVSALVQIEGTTSPQSTVTINSKQVEVQDTGTFTDTISLSPGTHTITIQATSRTGQTKTLQRTVLVE